MRIVLAVGGNALLRRGERPEAATQARHLDEAAPGIAALARDHQVVIVHGNGPQVGLLVDENRTDPALGTPYPLTDMVAESQGLIGFWIQRALARAGLARPVVPLVSRTLVDEHDPAMTAPTKFIGPMLDDASATAARARGVSVARDGDGWRQVVPSPDPIRVLECGMAGVLLDAGATVVLGGGGGIAIAGDRGHEHTVEAVVDKDLAAAAIAIELDAQLLVILTDVDGIMTDFGTPRQSVLRSVSAADLAGLHLAAGSMGPKAEAAARFTSATGRRSAIGALGALTDLVCGTAGTQVIPSR